MAELAAQHSSRQRFGALLLSIVFTLLGILVSLALLPALLFAIAIDGWAGASLDPIFVVRFVVFGIVVGVIAFLLGRHKGFLVAPAVFVSGMLALPFVDVTAVKPAVRAVHEIAPGMTEGEVRAIFDEHFPEHGRFRRPDIGSLYRGRLSFVLDPTDGALNAALVTVEFDNAGRCVSASFGPD